MVRIVVVLAALGALLLAPLFVSSPSGTTVEVAGAIIDVIAVAVLVFAAWSLWRGRRALV